MKILLTGGGSGGHFYPIIAVAQAINKIAEQENFVDVKLYYMAPQEYDKRALFENHLKFVKSNSGKLRRYFSFLNFLDIFVTAWGVIRGLWSVFLIYPDVIFGKGGYVSFPALVAARILRIPVVIHESDSVPGKVNAWAGKFAERVAISYPQAADHFKKEKVAYTGNPIRSELLSVSTNREPALKYFNLDPNIPTILILGGSQGAQKINETILDIIFTLVEKYQVIHQVGKDNITLMKSTSTMLLQKSHYKGRYIPLDHLNNEMLSMAASAANIVISRAGSTIFEIAVWGIPAILIPITNSNGDHQRKNAYSYARTGAGIVIEENNLTSHVLTAEIDRLMSNPALLQNMKNAAHNFARTDAANLIAQEIINIALQHGQ